MKDLVYVTGNADKARYFSQLIGIDIEHKKLDIEELQSIDLREIVEHKVRAAYKQVNTPVIVEDTRLTFNAMGSLPGPFVKWFVEEIGPEGMCQMLNAYDDRSAVAGAAMAYFDGDKVQIFEGSVLGRIADKPLGKSGFGWNPIFIPDNSQKSLGEMNDKEFKEFYMQMKPIAELAKFIHNLYT